jgi:sulfur carrier protein ThiS
MRITVKLFALLGRYLPPGSTANQAEIEVAKDATPADVIASLGLPGDLTHLVLVNGTYVPPGERASRPLRAGDTVAIWPPVAGG